MTQNRPSPPDPYPALPDSTKEALLIDAYNYARALIDLRFKHFTTCVVVQAFCAAGATQVDRLKDIWWAPVILGLVMTAFFWALDARTESYFRAYTSRAAAIEKSLKVPSVHPVHLKFRPTASQSTNLIFMTFFSCWMLAMALWIVGEISG